MSDETIEYLAAVLGDRTAVEWFTDAPVGSGAVAAPVDVFVTTTEGAVTWGWSVAPLPLEAGGRSFRRFRSADDRVMIVDADEPELVFVDHTLELHSTANGGAAIAIDRGTVPDATTAFDLARASGSEHPYGIHPAFAIEAVDATLELWAASLLERPVDFSWRPITDAERAEIDELMDAGADDEPPSPQVDRDPEIADLVGDFTSIAWFQSDLTWPDSENVEAFRDHVDARFRSPNEGIMYLASIGPLTPGEDLWFTMLDDGGLMSIDITDPTRIGLSPDRMVLALSRQSDGYEPAGVAVPWGEAPSPDEWSELRRYASEHPTAILIHAPGWSEHRVAAALETWADVCGGAGVEFAYDYEDAIPQAAIEANEARADVDVTENAFVRTASRERCMHRSEGRSPNEEPFPCGRPATHYHQASEGTGVMTVCADHVPSGVSVSPLLK